MSDASIDGYMFFVGEGRYRTKNKKYKSVGEIKGETLDQRFHAKHAFQIWYFKWASSHSNNSDNRLDPKVSVGAFEIRKELDIATPTLFLAHATCAVFPGAHVYFRKSGGQKMFTFFHAVFSDCIIEKWDCNLDSGTEEKLTVNFNWCEVNYYPQVADGTRKKGDPANMKQFCTSDPESQDVPRVFRRASKGDELQEGDLDFLNPE